MYYIICLQSVIISTKGIVIKAFNYRETSKIVEVFTESNGLVALIAKGVRNQPKLYGILEPLNIVFISYYSKKNQDLHLLSKMETISSYHPITKKPQNLLSGLVILDLIKQTQLNEIPNKYIFDLTIQSISMLKSQNINPYNIVIYFVLKLIFDLGFDLIEKLRPFLGKNYEQLCFDKYNGEIKQTFQSNFNTKISKDLIIKIFKLNEFEIENLDNIQFNSFELYELLNFIQEYLSYYLGKPFKLNILEIFYNAL